MLEEYRQKRSFEQTPEPIGRAKKHENLVLKFFVQKHSAHRLHYDFRLEFKGVLLSWAIPKGPSLNPDDKRLAVKVEDHPLEYGLFEGTIPKGNYGAGKVELWDKGYYKPIGTEQTDEKTILKGLCKGHLSIVAYGEKLKGGFDLINISKGKDEANWMLVKKSDQYASEEKITNQSNAVSGSANNIKDEIREIVDKAPEEKMPVRLGPMLAMDADQPFDKKNWIFELKYDGYRAVASIIDGKVDLYSRNKNSLATKFPAIVKELSEIKKPVLLDGEIVFITKKGTSDFQALQNYESIAEKEGKLIYYVFDILHFENKNLRIISLLKRKKILLSIIYNQFERIKYVDHIEKEGIKFFNLAVNSGFEGIMAKDADSNYFPEARTKKWLKIKKLKTIDVLIIGYTEPKGARSYFGSLVLGTYSQNDELCYIGNVGTGFDEKKASDLKQKMDHLKSKESPLGCELKIGRKITWITPKIICEIKYTEQTQEGILRHPVFLRVREDLTVKNMKTNKSTERIKISNPEKVFWPDEAYTKKDLLEYYDKMSDYILPYLKDRPLTLNRYPNGIYGESFYQKNVDFVAPSFLKTVEVKGVNYALCQNKESLMYLANLGCIEMNPWNSRVGSLDKPDYAVIDLDPLEISFSSVIITALTIKDILDKSNIPCFLKTSGATGLHIYIPFGTKYTHNQAKNFAKIIAMIARNKLPEIASTERLPEKRRGKVYIDFLQNGEGKTMASAYSVRPVKHAAVSTPLEWTELNYKLRPEQFTIKNIPTRIERLGDVFNGIFGEINLSESIENLNKYS